MCNAKFGKFFSFEQTCVNSIELLKYYSSRDQREYGTDARYMEWLECWPNTSPLPEILPGSLTRYTLILPLLWTHWCFVYLYVLGGVSPELFSATFFTWCGVRVQLSIHGFLWGKLIHERLTGWQLTTEALSFEQSGCKSCCCANSHKTKFLALASLSSVNFIAHFSPSLSLSLSLHLCHCLTPSFFLSLAPSQIKCLFLLRIDRSPWVYYLQYRDDLKGSTLGHKVDWGKAI